jgi:hypothetical protein
LERDDLREAWASFELHLQRTERLNDALVAQAMTHRAQTSLAREGRFLVLEIVVNFIAVIALGSFAFDRVNDVWAATSAAVLGVALIVVNATLLGITIAVRRLDFEEPVVAIQTALGRIALRRARLTTAILLAGPLLWTPLSIVGCALLGLNAVRAFGLAYVAANLAVGAFVIFGGWLAARYLGPRMRGSRWTTRAIDALSGNRYREAADFLNTIERFRMET